MAYEQITIREIVERAVEHKWSIPEFQRGFVWKTTQVRDLAESLMVRLSDRLAPGLEQSESYRGTTCDRCEAARLVGG